MPLLFRRPGAGQSLTRRICVALAVAVVTPAALGERRIEIQPAGRASWADLVQAEQARPHGPRPQQRVVPPPVEAPGPAGEIERGPAPAIEGRPPEGAAPSPCGPGLSALPLAQNFEALSDNNTRIPPDTMGAVGPNHVMTMLNTEVGVQTRDGSQLTRVTLSAFWTGGTGVVGNPFDPALLYDPLSGRWIATAAADSRSINSAVFFAISDTDDPTGMWTFYEIDADVDDVEWADFPGFGVNQTWVAITNNMFTVENNAFAGAKMWVIDKATALSGGPLTVTVFDSGFDVAGGSSSFTLRPAQDLDGSLPDLYIIDRPGFTSLGLPLLRLSRIRGTGAAPTWDALPGVFGDGSGHYRVENDFDIFLQDASQQGTAARIATNDVRILNAVVRNGRLWCAHHAALPEPGTVDRTAVFWYEWDPLAAAPLAQSGVLDGGAGTHLFFPTLSVNCANDMLLGFTRSDSGRYAETVYAGRLATDPPGSTRPVTLIKPGEDSYVKTFSGSTVRWGDYSATVVDPVDELSFWTIQQYAAADVGLLQTDDRWGTWWARIGPAAGCAPDLNGDGSVDGADLGLLLQGWGPCVGGDCPADLNGDDIVDGADLGLLLQGWGACPLANDAAADATPVAEGVYPFNSAGATTEETSPAGAIEKDLWWRYIASEDGRVSIAVRGAAFDAALAVYEDEGDARRLLGLRGATDNQRPIATIPVRAGARYLIRAGGVQGGAGAARLVIRFQ